MSVVSDTTCGTGGAMSPVPFGEMLMRTPEKIILAASTAGDDSPIIPSQNISCLLHKKTERTREADYVTEQGGLSSDDESAMSQSVLINTTSYTTTDTNNGEKVTHGLYPSQAEQDHGPRWKASMTDPLQQPFNTQILDEVFGDRRTCSSHESSPGHGATVEADSEVGGRIRPGGTSRCESQTTLPASEEFYQEVSSAERTSHKRPMDSQCPDLTGKAERCSLKQNPTGNNLVIEEIQNYEHANLAFSNSQGSKCLEDLSPATKADLHSAAAMHRHANIVSVVKASNMSPSQKPKSFMTVDYSSRKVGILRTGNQSELRTSVSDQIKGRLAITSQQKTSDTEAMMELKRRYQSIKACLQNNPDSRLVSSMVQEVKEMQTSINQTNQQHRQEREQLVDKVRKRSLSKGDKKHLKQDLQDLGVRQRHLVAVVHIHKKVSNKLKTLLAGFRKADADKVQKIDASSRQRNNDHHEECGKQTLTPSKPLNSIREMHHTTSLHKDSSAFSSGNIQDIKQTTHVEKSSPRINIDGSHQQNQMAKAFASQEETFHCHSQSGQMDRYTVMDIQDCEDSQTNGSKETPLPVSSKNLPQKRVMLKSVNPIDNNQDVSNQIVSSFKVAGAFPLVTDTNRDTYSKSVRITGLNSSAVMPLVSHWLLDNTPNKCQDTNRRQSDLEGASCLQESQKSKGRLQMEVSSSQSHTGRQTEQPSHVYEDSQKDLFSQESSVLEFDRTAIDAIITGVKTSQSDEDDVTTEREDNTTEREDNTTEDGDMTVDREEFTGERLTIGTENYKRLNKEVNINRQHKNDQHQGISVGGLSEGNTSGDALKRINEATVRPHSCEVSSKKRKTEDGLLPSASQLLLPGDLGPLVLSTSTAAGSLQRVQTPSGGTYSISMNIPSVRAHILGSKDSMLSVPSPSGSSTNNSSSLGPPSASKQNEEQLVPALKSCNQLPRSYPSEQAMDEVSVSKASQDKYTSTHDVRISPIPNKEKKDLSAHQKESSPCHPDASQKYFMPPPSLHRSPMEGQPLNTTDFSRTVTSPCSTAASSDVFPVSCREIVRKMEARSALARQTQKEQNVHQPGSAADCIVVPTGKVADSFPKTNENTPKERSCVTSKHTFIQPSIPQELNKTGYGIKKTDLATMVEKGLLTPGQNVMSVKTKTRVFRGSLTERGTIVGSGGEMFRTPTAWFQRITGATVVKTTLAYSRVMYKGQPLSSFELVPNTKPTSYNIQPYPVNVNNQHSHRLGSVPAVTILPGKVGKVIGTGVSTPPTASLNTMQTSCSGKSISSSSPTRSRTVGETLSKMLWSNCTIRLIDDAEIVPCPDIDANFWKTDFKDVRMSDNLWKSVDCWN